MFIDKETFNVSFALIFNRQDQHWKTMQTVYKVPQQGAIDDNGVSVFMGMSMTDRLSNTATVGSKFTPTIYPVTTAREIKRVFSVSTLSEGQ